MSILENVLIILEQEPRGSLPVFEVKARVTERLTNQKRLADEMRAARESLKLGVPLQRRTAQSAGIFGELIDERDGTWAITEAGRRYLHMLGLQQEVDHP